MWIVFWHPHRDLRIIGDHVKAAFALATSVTFLGIAILLFGFATAFWGDRMPQELSQLRFSLTYPEDVSVTEEDNIVVGIGFYNRIQIYDHAGQFQYGFFHETGGGRFALFADGEGDIHVYPIRLKREFIYDPGGVLLGSMPIGAAEWDRRRELRRQENENRGVHSSFHKGLIFSTVRVQFPNRNVAHVGTELWEIPFAQPFGQIGFMLATFAVSWILRRRKLEVRQQNRAIVRLPVDQDSATHLCELGHCQRWQRPDRVYLGPSILFIKDDQCFCGKSVWDQFDSIPISDVRIQYQRQPFFGTARVTVLEGDTTIMSTLVQKQHTKRPIEFAEQNGVVIEYSRQSPWLFILKVTVIVTPMAFLPWSVPPVIMFLGLVCCSLWSFGAAVLSAIDPLWRREVASRHGS